MRVCKILNYEQCAQAHCSQTLPPHTHTLSILNAEKIFFPALFLIRFPEHWQLGSKQELESSQGI